MNTLIPENPPCAMCGSSFEMHQDSPSGIRFVIPRFSFVDNFNEGNEFYVSDVMLDTMTCYEYVHDVMT